IAPLVGVPEVVSRPNGALTPPAPGRASVDIIRDWLSSNQALYGLSTAEVEGLHFIGESVSRGNGLRMVRMEQRVNGLPVFQSETRFLLDREGRLVKTLGVLVPNASALAPPPGKEMAPQQALVAAMASVGIDLAAQSVNAKAS